MGFVEREKELKESMEKQKAAEAHRMQLEEEKRLALENKNNLKVRTKMCFMCVLHKFCSWKIYCFWTNVKFPPPSSFCN